jgi:hypothetical protein
MALSAQKRRTAFRASPHDDGTGQNLMLSSVGVVIVVPQCPGSSRWWPVNPSGLLGVRVTLFSMTCARRLHHGCMLCSSGTVSA